MLFQNMLNLISDNGAVINTICTVFLVIPVVSLIIDKIKSKKPKISVNFQLVRSSLACIVIENYGDVAAELKSLTINEEFLLELDKKLAKKLLSLKKTRIYLAPGQKWIINFETNIFDIIEHFERKECKIKFLFSRPAKKWNYKGQNDIKFDEYSHFTLYISELGEINDTLKKINNTLKEIATNRITDNAKTTTDISDLQDEFVRKKSDKT